MEAVEKTLSREEQSTSFREDVFMASMKNACPNFVRNIQLHLRTLKEKTSRNATCLWTEDNEGHNMLTTDQQMI